MPPEDPPKEDPKPPNPGPPPDPPGDPTGDEQKPPKFVPAGELVAERRVRQAAQAALKAAQDKVREFEDQGKTDVDRLTGDRDGHKTRADKAEAELLRLQVGLAKGLTTAQARRLVGATKEELETDADELVEAFGGQKNVAPQPPGKPRENLRGGGEPGDEPEELDPAKLAAMIPRN